MHQDNSYKGPERRTHEQRSEPTLDSIWILLLEVNGKITSHIDDESHLRPHVEELVDLLQKSKGVLVFLKALIYIVAPVSAFIYWIKDHVKL